MNAKIILETAKHNGLNTDETISMLLSNINYSAEEIHKTIIILIVAGLICKLIKEL